MKNSVELAHINGLRHRAIRQAGGEPAGESAPMAMLEPAGPYVINPGRFVTVRLGSELTGLSEKSVRRRIADRVWEAGKEYRRCGDGRVYLDLPAIEAWIVRTSRPGAKR